MCRLPARGRSGKRLISSRPNQIALLAAWRGTLSTALPLAVLHALGHPSMALFVAIGGLITSLADSGGPYRSRLLAMGLSTLILPISLFIGTLVHDNGWLATGLIFGLALAGGLIRAFGQTGIALGLFIGLVFLVGMHLPATFSEALQRAGYYCLGGMWTMAVTLAFWRLLPYKRIELEVATCWMETASLIALIRRLDAPPVQTPEQAVVEQHRVIRDTIEQVRYTLGEAFAETAGTNPTLNQMIILLRAASHISAAALSLGTILGTSSLHTRDGSVGQVLDTALGELEKACRGMAAIVRTARGRVSLDHARHAMQELTALIESQQTDRSGANAAHQELQALFRALSQAMGCLQTAADASQQLFGRKRRLPGLFPPLNRAASSREVLTILRSHLTFRSLIFRHALRVAMATSAGTALFTLLKLPHGMWIPLTSLIILQPHFGATLERALHRTAGTLAGAIIASFLLMMLEGDIAMYLVFSVLFFGTFLFFRHHYGLAVMFLTPSIILLLNLVVSAPWDEVGYRILNTLIGAALALMAGYLLWPSWERERLPERLATAIRANRDYGCAVLKALATDAPPGSSLLELRRRAEIESGNAMAAVQRMLAEPKAYRIDIDKALPLAGYVQSLCRHLTAVAVQLEGVPQSPPRLSALAEILDSVLDEAAAAIQTGRPVRPLPAVEEINSPVSAAPVNGTHTLLDSLLDKIFADVNGLYSALR